MTRVICASASPLANTLGVAMAPFARGACHLHRPYFCTCRVFTVASVDGAGPMACAPVLALLAYRGGGLSMVRYSPCVGAIDLSKLWRNPCGGTSALPSMLCPNLGG